MQGLLLLALLGVGIGGFYGLLAAGIVVGHKGSGLINLDQGALAMYPAYSYVTLRTEGVIFLPWFDFVPGPIDIPYRIQVADNALAPWPAFGGAVLMAMALGLLLQTLVFGPLRHKPPISKIIGSLGALLYLTGIAQFQFGTRARQIDGVVPDLAWVNPFGLDGQLPLERIVLAGAAIFVGIALTLYYGRTRHGLATRAVEEAELGAALLGYSPYAIARINWLISSTITGTAGILALEFVSLTPTRYTLFVVPALGAALVGNLSSPIIAAVAGVVLGMFQSAAAGLTLFRWWPEWLPSEGMRQAVPLVLIAAVQFIRSDRLPVRSTRLEEAQPTAPAPKNVGRGLTIVALIASWFLIFGSTVTEGKLVTSLVAAILMLGSMVIIGYLGQLSLAGLAFAGISAYLATRFASDGRQYGASPLVLDGPGLPAPLAALCGVAIAVLAGLLLAIPAVRVRGLQLAIISLAVAVAAPSLVLGNPVLMGPGAASNVPVPPPTWFGLEVGPSLEPSGFTSRTTLAIFCLAWLLMTVAAVGGLRSGHVGRRFLAVRSNERAAEAAGVDVAQAKLLGFGISAAIAGVAGALLSYHQTVLQISTWGALAGMNSVSLLFLGGVGRVSGALFGAALTPGGLFSSTSNEGQVLQIAVSGAAMIAIAILRPDGLTSLAEPVWNRVAPWFSARYASGPDGVPGAVLEQGDPHQHQSADQTEPEADAGIEPVLLEYRNEG